MEYLFFDTECASVSKTAAKICAFGYCLTDEQFNIIEKRDILINPKGGFHLVSQKGEGIVLPYDYDDFKKYPTFPEVYPFIKELILRAKTVVGHSIMNDVKYLNLECKRFGLDFVDFSFYDTQFIYMDRIKEFNRQFALGTIANDLGVDFVPHRAADDAYATMRIAQAMCLADGVSFEELIENHSILCGKNEKGVAVNCSSKSLKEYLRAVKENKEKRDRARNEFCNYVCSRKGKRNKNGALSGKIFTFNKAIEENLSVSKDYVKKIYANGGSYSLKTDKCNVYVKTEDDRSMRYVNAVKSNISVIEEDTLKDFIAL